MPFITVGWPTNMRMACLPAVKATTGFRSQPRPQGCITSFQQFLEVCILPLAQVFERQAQHLPFVTPFVACICVPHV